MNRKDLGVAISNDNETKINCKAVANKGFSVFCASMNVERMF